MQATKSAAVLLILALLTTAAADTAQTPPEKDENSPSAAYSASCLVKITADAALLPLDQETICMLFESSGVAGKATREVLGLSPDKAPNLFEIVPVSSALSYSPPATAPTTSRSSYGVSTSSRSTLSQTTLPAVFDAASSPVATARSSSGSSNARPPSQTPAPPSSSAAVQTPRNRTTTTRRSYGQSSSGGGHASEYGTGFNAFSYASPSRTAPSPQLSTEQTVIYLLSVSLSKDEGLKPLAEEFMDALIENFKDTLEGAFEDTRSRLDARFKAAELEAERAEAQLLKMQSELREMAGGQNLSRNDVIDRISFLTEKLQQLDMDMASGKALIDETTRRIAKTKERIQQQLTDDTVTTELERILKINEDQLKAIEEKFKAGIASQADATQAMEKLARARIELASRRQDLGKAAGGGLLDSLNGQLENLVLDQARFDAEMESLSRQLSDSEDLAAKADQYELLSLKADIVRKGLQESLVWQDQLDRRMRLLLPPAVSVIGGD